ncbi:hypothetical protein VTK56DRAFT_2722 [Thermocarpiscus australiensis]
MLERSAASIEPCTSLQRVFPSARTCLQSRRQLHTSFWHHGAAEFELLDACQALMRQPPSEQKPHAVPPKPSQRPDSIATSGFLLDFLYPSGTAALLRRRYPTYSMRLELCSWPRTPISRLFTSSVTRVTGQTSNLQAAAEEASTPTEDEPEGGAGNEQGPRLTVETSERPASSEAGFSNSDTLRKLLRSDRAGDYGQIFQLYTNLEPSLRDQFTAQVLLAIAQSSRPIEAWRVNELFALYQVEQWTDEIVYAAIKAQLTLRNPSEAMSIFRTAVERHAFGKGLDLLAAYGLEVSAWDMVLEAWEFYSANIQNPEPVFLPSAVQTPSSVAEPIAEHDTEPVAETVAESTSLPDSELVVGSTAVQDGESAVGSAAVQRTESVANPMESPDAEPIVESPATLDYPSRATESTVVQDAEAAADLTAARYAEPVTQSTEQQGALPAVEPTSVHDADSIADPVAEQSPDSSSTFSSLAEQGAGFTNTYPMLAAISGFEAKVRELYKFLENDPESMPQRTGLVESFLRHVARCSVELFRPSDAVFILERVNDPYAYERYILHIAGRKRKRFTADLYRKYRAVPGVHVSDSVLRVMLKLFYPQDDRGMEQLLEDWYRCYGRLDERTYKKAMAFYSKRGDVKSLQRLAKDYARHFDSSVDKSPNFVARLMHAHAVRGDCEAARQVMEDAAEKSGEPPSTRLLNILLNAYSKTGDYERAIDLFAHICKEYEPDSYTFATIMSLAARRGDLQFTLELYQLARDRNVQLDVAMMQTLVEAYCQNDRYPEAERLCMRLTKRRDVPGDYTYLWNTLLRYNAKRRDLTTVNRLLEFMSAQGIRYNHDTYSQLLLALLYCRQSHHAMHLLRVAHREGVFEPSPDHYVLLMAAFIYSGEPHMALKTNELMAQMNFPESAKRMTKVIDALGRWQELPESRRRGFDGDYFLRKILHEFYKAMQRQDQDSPDDARSVVGLYSKVLFILTQMREHATVHQIIHLHNTRYPARSRPETLPLRLLHNIMLADFYERKYGRVKETWKLVLERTTKRYGTAAAHLNKGGGGPSDDSKPVAYSQRFRLCDPLKTMQRLYLDEGDADGLLSVVAAVRKRGFDLDSKNWNYHVQALARLKRWREAFSVCEKVLMPQWTGWARVRQKEGAKVQLPLELRRVGSDPRRPRPIAHTLLLLAKEYMDLEQMMLWSREASREFQFVTNNCPKTVHAVTTMVRSWSPLEAQVFGGETGPAETGPLDEIDLGEDWEGGQENDAKKKGARGEQKNVTGNGTWTGGGLLNVGDSVPQKHEQLSEADVVNELRSTGEEGEGENDTGRGQ